MRPWWPMRQGRVPKRIEYDGKDKSIMGKQKLVM
jgi:hypothetical protein